jgi:hypothetical protein
MVASSSMAEAEPNTSGMSTSKNDQLISASPETIVAMATPIEVVYEMTTS